MQYNKRILGLALACVTAGMFTSCQQEDFGVSQEEVTRSKYDRDFVNIFGQPADGHQWGFGETANIAITRGESNAPSIVGGGSYTSKRVMCEDLGGVQSDFDFNDIVYDVIYTSDNCFIVVQAVGGTLPIKLAYDGTAITDEIHATMNAESNQPINVQATKNGKTANPLILALGFNGKSGSAKLGGTEYTYTSVSSSPFDIKKISLLVNNSQSTWVNVNYQTTTTPLCICVPTTVCWLQEGKRIDSAYDKFSEWVADEAKDCWSTPTDGTKLCGAVTTPVPDEVYSNPDDWNLAPKR